jgi:hypothetical protein
LVEQETFNLQVVGSIPTPVMTRPRPDAGRGFRVWGGSTVVAFVLRPLPHVHLVQLLLPLYDNAGAPFPRTQYERVTAELTGSFGGLTAYTRAPAEGLWSEQGEGTRRDDIVVYEMHDGPARSAARGAVTWKRGIKPSGRGSR